ncbi:unnamed protein product [Dicrocoelium dendriticum]|nr:unnamed protein product [Dicrocoelium dendriticum]
MLKGNVVFITAKYDIILNSTDKSTHELCRELHLPMNVNSSTVECNFIEPGILTIEAEASEPKAPISPTNPRCGNEWTPDLSRQSRRFLKANYRPACAVDPRRVTFNEPVILNRKHDFQANTRQISNQSPNNCEPYNRLSSSNFIPRSIVRDARVRSPEPLYFQQQQQRLETVTSPLIKESPDRSRKAIYFPRYSNSVTPSPVQSQKRYGFRVEIGTHITPDDLTITRHNGVLVVHAKRYLLGSLFRSRDRSEKLIFEHRSEHTLPGNIALDKLTARLENGIVYVDAPYVASTAPQLPSSLCGTNAKIPVKVTPYRFRS